MPHPQPGRAILVAGRAPGQRHCSRLPYRLLRRRESYSPAGPFQTSEKNNGKMRGPERQNVDEGWENKSREKQK